MSKHSHPVVVCDGYPEEGYRVLELSDELVARLEAGRSLVLRGRAEDTATLVDDSSPAEAYQLMTAHTSNNLYLLELSQQLTLRACVNQIWELNAKPPQIGMRLRSMLSAAAFGAFRGLEFDRVAQRTGTDVTDRDLRKNVQASTGAVLSALGEVPAVKVNGAWRELDAAYVAEILNLVLATQVERDWSIGSIDVDAAFDALRADGDPELLRDVVLAVLRKFGTPLDARELQFAVVPIKVVRFFARQILLSQHGHVWPVSEFVRALLEVVPPQLHPAIPHASDDVALADDWWSNAISHNAIVRDLVFATMPLGLSHASSLYHPSRGFPPSKTYLTVLFRDDLPDDPRARMAALFAAKQKWTRPEISPFLEDISGFDVEGDNTKPLKTIGNWLVKYARSVKLPDGQVLYTSRLN